MSELAGAGSDGAPEPLRRPARVRRLSGAVRESQRCRESWLEGGNAGPRDCLVQPRDQLPYSGEFQRERADLLNYMKAIFRRAPSL